MILIKWCKTEVLLAVFVSLPEAVPNCTAAYSGSLRTLAKHDCFFVSTGRASHEAILNSRGSFVLCWYEKQAGTEELHGQRLGSGLRRVAFESRCYYQLPGEWRSERGTSVWNLSRASCQPCFVLKESSQKTSGMFLDERVFPSGALTQPNWKTKDLPVHSWSELNPVQTS